MQSYHQADEYLLIENRQQAGFDLEFWSSGVVIYHIDDGANEQYARGYPGLAGFPKVSNSYH
jgi:hypothetical protein